MKAQPDRDGFLTGTRILVVDDEFLIAIAIEDALSDAGAEVHCAATLPAAMAAADDPTLSAAVLDVRLGRQTTEAVADLLASLAVPFIFHSGHALPDAIRAKHPTALLLLKPMRPEALVQAMRNIAKR